MFQPSNLVLQEDLVFGGMFSLNILETENGYPSGKDPAFSLSLGVVTEHGHFGATYIFRYQSWAESRASDFCPCSVVAEASPCGAVSRSSHTKGNTGIGEAFPVLERCSPIVLIASGL